MILTIKSRKFEKEITFSRPGSSYVYADINGKEGTLGNQICKGGRLTGSTISYDGDDYEKFSKICKNWWRAYISE